MATGVITTEEITTEEAMITGEVEVLCGQTTLDGGIVMASKATR